MKDSENKLSGSMHSFKRMLSFGILMVIAMEIRFSKRLGACQPSSAEGGICFSRAISERAACEAGGEARQRGLESGREHERKTSDAERNLIRQILSLIHI